jgi:NAD-dependent deacetylase
LERAEIFVAVGTSGNVYPAAGFVQTARRVKARTIEVNLQRTEKSGAFEERRIGMASVEVPRLVEELLGKAESGK